MAKRRSGGLRRGGRWRRNVPWWLYIAAGVAGFTLLRLWAAGWLARWIPSDGLVDRGVSNASALALLGFGVALAVRGAWRARQRRIWFKRMCDLSAIRRLDWKRFEQLVAEAYSRQGYAAHLTGQGGADGGVDVVLRGSGTTWLVQCKQWQSNSVGVKVIREMFGLMAAEGADGVVVVCTGGFTREAKDFAKGRPVELVDGAGLVELMKAVV